MGPVLSKAASVECISPVTPRAPDATMLQELEGEPWYQGEMSRKEAEGLLKNDGDFLVRKSATNPGSFVLTGMHNGQAKHLLLVDPEGTVSTGGPPLPPQGSLAPAAGLGDRALPPGAHGPAPGSHLEASQGHGARASTLTAFTTNKYKNRAGLPVPSTPGI